MMKGGTLVSDFTVRLGHQCSTFVPLDRNGLDLILDRPVQLHFDEASALDTQFAVIEQSAAIAVGRKGDTVLPPERTEAREAGLLAACYPREERLEGFIQPAEHPLAAGEVGQSEQPFFPYGLQLLGLVVVVDALAANFSSVAPFLKGCVVEFASPSSVPREPAPRGLRTQQRRPSGTARRLTSLPQEHPLRRPGQAVEAPTGSRVARTGPT